MNTTSSSPFALSIQFFNKKAFLLAACILFITTLYAQQTVTITNRYTGENLVMTNYVLGLSKSTNDIWIIEKTTEAAYVRIKHATTNTYLNVETATLVSSKVGTGFYSAQWTLKPIGDYMQIINRWKGTYLNNEHTKLDATALGQPGWFSAQWTIKDVKSLYSRISGSGSDAVQYIDIDYKAMTNAAADHINGIAFNGSIIVDLPYYARDKGDILWWNKKNKWNQTAFDMIDKVGNEDRFPSGMQAAGRLLAVAENKYVRFFDLAPEAVTATELKSLAIKMEDNKKEVVGLVYHPKYKRYYAVTPSKVYVSPVGEEPFLNGAVNPRFNFQNITQINASTGTVTFGEAGFALLYDEKVPDNLICLSLGTDLSQGSYQYCATTIRLSGNGAQASISDSPFANKTLTPPSDYDRTGAGPSFRWGGSAFMDPDANALYLFASPKRLDNVANHSSDVLMWIFRM